MDNFKLEMQDHYDGYIRDVSPMAPSMKTLDLLLSLCLPGANVLDLGTGFSSFLLRYYADELGLTVWSVDDNPGWLEKTRKYCESMGVDYGGFLVWDMFLSLTPPEFDVIFMDLGTTRRRPNYYPLVLSDYCLPKTLLLADDMHKPSLKHALEHELKHYHHLNIPVRDQTLDEFGRYCKLVFRLRPRQKGV